ncbi:hypothetical protein B0T19DRAFT_264208 [Cercophora scortea]|uniref:Uncharacterized protein n=1 Tax=Cercophora scortea TaxID=314031 RepID=A0AAE0IAA4_9PEZI|nr:hypothetical protein B0T19DRAFT_264208 [Cercophora scortea]
MGRSGACLDALKLRGRSSYGRVCRRNDTHELSRRQDQDLKTGTTGKNHDCRGESRTARTARSKMITANTHKMRKVLFLTSQAKAQDRNEKKKRWENRAGQTSIDTHPARAPKGKTSKAGYRSSPLSIQPRHKRASDRHLRRQIESKMVSHCRAPRILFINPGGICGSFREHKRGQLL